MRLVHNSLHDEVAAQLRERIFAGELTPGMFLDEVKLPCEVCGGKRFKDEVLAYTYKGKSISDVLEISPRTVQKHLEHVYEKLGVETRSAAVAIAIRAIEQ